MFVGALKWMTGVAASKAGRRAAAILLPPAFLLALLSMDGGLARRMDDLVMSSRGPHPVAALAVAAAFLLSVWAFVVVAGDADDPPPDAEGHFSEAAEKAAPQGRPGLRPVASEAGSSLSGLCHNSSPPGHFGSGAAERRRGR